MVKTCAAFVDEKWQRGNAHAHNELVARYQ
jgi:hypothetical protein